LPDEWPAAAGSRGVVPEVTLSLVQEDLIRRSEGLRKRANDLRSYL
jgi:hypothetical protein